MYYVHGKYCGESEIVDEANTKKELLFLLSEYRMAFGPEWEIWGTKGKRGKRLEEF